MAATTETVDARRRWRMRRPPESAAIPATSPEARVTTDRDRCNLTNGQLAMWMGQHLAPELSCFDNPLSFMIRGELDVERFSAAFQALVDRSDGDGVKLAGVIEKNRNRRSENLAGGLTGRAPSYRNF